MNKLFALYSLLILAGCSLGFDLGGGGLSTKKVGDDEVQKTSSNSIQAICTPKPGLPQMYDPFFDSVGNCSRPLARHNLVPGPNNRKPLLIRSNGDIVVVVDQVAIGVSRDSGLNWSHYTTADGLTNTSFTDIAEHPSGSVYFCGSGNVNPVYVTRDNFQSFQPIGGFPENVCRGIVILGNGTIAIAHRDGVSISTDNGVTFNYTLLAAGGNYTYGIDYDHLGHIYVIHRRGMPATYYLMKSTDNGASFVEENTSALFPYIPGPANAISDLEINKINGDIYITGGFGTHKSSDAGMSFTNLGNNFFHPTLASSTIAASMYHMSFDRLQSRLWGISENGYHFSDDGGLSFSFIAHNSEYPDDGPTELTPGLIGQDMFFMERKGLKRYRFATGTFDYQAPIATDNNYRPGPFDYFETDGGNFVVSYYRQGFGLGYSEDGGQTYQNVDTNSVFPAGFVGPTRSLYAVRVVNENFVLLAVLNAGILLTTDKFKTFTSYQTSDGIGITGVEDAAFLAASGPNHWMFSKNSGELFLTTNGGISFQQIDGNPGLVGCLGSFPALEISTNKDLYVACAGGGAGLYISTDAGASFVHKTTADGMASDQIWDIRRDPSSNKVYLNHLMNAFGYTADSGTTFVNQTAADGLANGPFFISLSLYISPNGTVYLGVMDAMLSQNLVTISIDGGNSYTVTYTPSEGIPSYSGSIHSLVESGGKVLANSRFRYTQTP